MTHRLALLWVPLALLILEVSARAEAPAPYSVETSRPSKRGPRLLLARRDSDRAVLRVQFRAGSFNDGARPGLTHVAQHALIGASAEVDYETLRLDLFRSAATLEIETGVRESAITLTASKKHFDRLAKRVLKLCFRPRLDPDQLEAVKRRALESGPPTDLDGLVPALARAAMTDPAYGSDPEGEPESIRAIESRDVLAHLAGPMAPANATVIVTGAVKSAKLRAAVESFTGGTRAGPIKRDPDLAGRYQLKGPLEIELVAYPIRLEAPKASAAAHLASALLADRLLWRFRRLGVSSGTIMAAPIHREWLDGLVIAVPSSVAPNTPPGAIVAEIVEQVRSGAFTEGELEDARRSLLIHFREVDHDPAALARALSMSSPNLPWLSPELVEELARITKAELMEAIGTSLVDERSIHVRLSPTAASGQARSDR